MSLGVEITASKNNLCRLCGCENLNGVELISKDDQGRSLYNLINQHLPVKIDNNEKLPQSICSGCLIQVQSIIEFFYLLQAGQKKLEQLFGKEDSCINTTEDETPKRKRGRPKKIPQDQIPLLENEVKIDNVTKVVNNEFTGKRRRKTPVLYHGAVQGKELDKVLQEEGILDENESKNADRVLRKVQDEEVIGRVESLEGEDLGEVKHLHYLSNKKNQSRCLIEFKCEICGDLFQHEKKFLLHQASHETAKQLICTTCSEKFSNVQEFDTHKENTKHEEFYEINIEQKCHCGQIFTGNLQEHINKKHPKEIKCNICNKTFRFNAGLNSHIQHAHPELENGGYPCDICGKKLKHPSSIVYHKQIEHNVKRNYSCLKCNKVFKHRMLLLKHQLVHSELRPFKCTECDATFKSKVYLTHHSVVHTKQKKYRCSICEQLFSHYTSLKHHMSWHSGEKPYQCEYCKRCFGQKGNLKEHIRIHTDEKPYKCGQCDRTFKTSSQCKSHIKSHSGEKNWKCEFCNKTFLNKFSLVTHVRRHAGNRPYECSVCSRTFIDHWSLTKHSRLHTGEKPYKCSICNRAFSDSSNMIKHRNTHLKKVELEVLQQETNPNLDLWTVFKADEPKEKKTDLQQIFFISYPEGEQEITQELLMEKEAQKQQENTEINGMMHVTDEHGNPVSFTTQEGAMIQLITDGESLRFTMGDGNSIPVQFSNGDNIAPLETVILPTINETDQNESLEFVSQQDVPMLDPIAGLHEPSLDFLPLT